MTTQNDAKQADLPALNGVRTFNYTSIAEVVERLIAMTPGERATVALELAEHDPKLADGLADLLIDSVYDALRENARTSVQD